MILKDYLICQDNLIKTEDEEEALECWVQIINKIHNINSRSDISLSKLHSYMIEISNELNLLSYDIEEIQQFYHNNELYKIDYSVVNANVGLYADFLTLKNNYTDHNRLPHIVSLLIYKEDEADEYDYATRYAKNIDRVMEMDVQTVMNIVGFFFKLQNYLESISQASLLMQHYQDLIAEELQSTEL